MFYFPLFSNCKPWVSIILKLFEGVQNFFNFLIYHFICVYLFLYFFFMFLYFSSECLFQLIYLFCYFYLFFFNFVIKVLLCFGLLSNNFSLITFFIFVGISYNPLSVFYVAVLLSSFELHASFKNS